MALWALAFRMIITTTKIRIVTILYSNSIRKGLRVRIVVSGI